MIKKIVIIEKDCDNLKFDSNINEVIRAVLNFLFFSLRKDFAHIKSTKSTESTKSIKNTKQHKETRSKAEKSK